MTANIIRKEIKKMYQKHFAVSKMKFTGLDNEWCISNAYADDFTEIADKLISLNFIVEKNIYGNKNSFIIKEK